MKKTFIIIQREYLSRVKKKTFIIMTILGPLLMAALMIVPVMITKMSNEKKVIDVVDETSIYYQKLKNNSSISFNYLDVDITEAKAKFDDSKSSALLYIPLPSYNKPTHAILFYSDKQPGITVTSYIQDKMKYVLESKILLDNYNIDKKIIDQAKVSISINSENIHTGQKNLPILTTAIGMICGILIYFFIFLFGSQVMRGVIEEKTSRIVEVIVSSVKPFQLMMGKIIGIALVGLTQFLLWVILTLGIVTVFQFSMADKFAPQKQNNELSLNKNVLVPDQTASPQNATEDQELAKSFFETIGNYNFVALGLFFLFYFMFGYLMYAALFAAIGSAVDNEADTQQFMLPITIPLIFAFVMSNFILEDPQGPVAFWLSVIPFTSPIVMMIRLPFEVPLFDVILSMVLLVLGFLGTTWLAGRIYRTGILMYGKKVNYRELWKWLSYKN